MGLLHSLFLFFWQPFFCCDSIYRTYGYWGEHSISTCHGQCFVRPRQRDLKTRNKTMGIKCFNSLWGSDTEKDGGEDVDVLNVTIRDPGQPYMLRIAWCDQTMYWRQNYATFSLFRIVRFYHLSLAPKHRWPVSSSFVLLRDGIVWRMTILLTHGSQCPISAVQDSVKQRKRKGIGEHFQLHRDG